MGDGMRFKRGCVLTANSWGGDFPLPGEFVKSARGRTAFMILEVRKAPASAKYAAKFVCERHPVATLPADARVHPWKWASR